MESVETKNSARLGFRLKREDKRLIERAASVAGQSVRDYALSVLVRDARKTLCEVETTRLSDRDRDAFVAMLDQDAEPNAALKQAARRCRQRRV